MMRRKTPYRPLYAAALALGCSRGAAAQQAESPEQQIERLSAAVDRAQAQVQASEQELLALKQSLAALEERLGKAPLAKAGTAGAPSAAEAARAEEHQAMQDSQIATLDQSKVGSGSRYPVTISGLILLNGFINDSGVNVPLAPEVAVAGDGTTGASIRQTSFTVDARGPMLAGARSHADAEVDFLGTSAYSDEGAAAGLLRLRTAHAALDWSRTRAEFQFDRPILNPNYPTSLAAIAEPPLAWSGNLWQWVPQAGIARSVPLGGASKLEIGAALIDVPDPPFLTTNATASAGEAERSRWPGTELRLGVAGGNKPSAASIGVGGYFSPHNAPDSRSYNAWAGTLDWRMPLRAGFSLTGSAYRGLALGGLGGGAYKDVIARQVGTALDWRPLDDVGGWAQLKKQAGQRLEFNAALGLDQAFATELRSFPLNDSLPFPNLARNRTLMGNAIWSPSAYLLFSFEYRRISSYSMGAPTAGSNVLGLAAGYKF